MATALPRLVRTILCKSSSSVHLKRPASANAINSRQLSWSVYIRSISLDHKRGGSKGVARRSCGTNNERTSCARHVATSTIVATQAVDTLPPYEYTNTNLKARGRASLEDVERISRGEKAKRRGTGSRSVCHRLNLEERGAFDLAKQRRYVVMRGRGWRKERKGSPLANIWRQHCDARAWCCVCVELAMGPHHDDVVMVDLSPLRGDEALVADITAHVLRCAATAGCAPLEGPDAAPATEEEANHEPEADVDLDVELAAANAAVSKQAEVVRGLKEAEGRGNEDEQVQAQVAVLKALKARVGEIEGTLEEMRIHSEDDADRRLVMKELVLEGAVWELPRLELRFTCPSGRAQGKHLAGLLARTLNHRLGGDTESRAGFSKRKKRVNVGGDNTGRKGLGNAERARKKERRVRERVSLQDLPGMYDDDYN